MSKCPWGWNIQHKQMTASVAWAQAWHYIRKMTVLWYNWLYSDSLRLVEEELDYVVPAFGMVEEHKEGPVNEPGPLLEWLEWRAHRLKGNNKKHEKMWHQAGVSRSIRQTQPHARHQHSLVCIPGIIFATINLKPTTTQEFKKKNMKEHPRRCTYGIHVKIPGDFLLELSLSQDFQKGWPSTPNLRSGHWNSTLPRLVDAPTVSILKSHTALLSSYCIHKLLPSAFYGWERKSWKQANALTSHGFICPPIPIK